MWFIFLEGFCFHFLIYWWSWTSWSSFQRNLPAVLNFPLLSPTIYQWLKSLFQAHRSLSQNFKLPMSLIISVFQKILSYLICIYFFSNLLGSNNHSQPFVLIFNFTTILFLDIIAHTHPLIFQRLNSTQLWSLNQCIAEQLLSA